MAERRDRLFLSWESSNSRSDTLAKCFSAQCFHISYLSEGSPWLSPLRYLLQTLKTWRVLFASRPRMVFVQNPPPFAALAVWCYSVFFRCRLVLDSHTGAFLDPKFRWLSVVHRFVANRAAVSIVTNDYLAEILRGWQAKYYVFPDVPTEFPAARLLENSSGPYVTVINSFSYDEPLSEVLQAAALSPSVKFFVTGDVTRCPKDLLMRAPKNVEFTGFLSRKEYVDRVFSSEAAIVLTKRNHTMQRGAYEAMSLGVPIVTSDWPLLKETFSDGTVHTDNSAEAIAAAVDSILENKQRFRAGITALKELRRRIWAEKFSEFSRLYLGDGDLL